MRTTPRTHGFNRRLLAATAVLYLLWQLHPALGEDRSTSPPPPPPTQDSAASPADPAAEEQLAEGGRRFRGGDYAGAVESWQAVDRGYARSGTPRGRVHALANLGAAYLQLGDYRLAELALTEALDLARQTGQRPEEASILSTRGAVRTCRRQADGALADLDEAVRLAAEAGDAAGAVQAQALNNRANLAAMRAATLPDEEAEVARARALEDYTKAAALAEQAGDRSLAAKARVNAARTVQQAGQPERADHLNGEAVAALATMPDSAEKAHLLIAAGQNDYRLAAAAAQSAPAAAADGPARRARLLRRAYQAYAQAEELARRTDDGRTRSYALGYAAQLYESQGRPGEALVLARRAADVAQRARAPEVLYRWQWHTARLLRDQAVRAADVDDRARLTGQAITAYGNARDSLQLVRSDVALGYGNTGLASSFREDVGPLFTELADLLLRRAAAGQDSEPEAARRDLVDARAAVELLKAGELEDYFQDDCVNQVRRQQRQVEQVIEQGTAVVYLIPLADRIELLVSTAGGRLARFQSDVTAGALVEQVEGFRVALQEREFKGYRVPGERLYEWLIVPVRDYLEAQGVDTLVFVPDGALRTVPMAALYDRPRGQYLVEQYAVAVTPGLSLVAPTPLSRARIRALGGGITQAAAGFNALPSVAAELANLRELYGATILQDEGFTRESLASAITAAPYSIVHIASHGEFAGEADETFVLTSDGVKLTLNDLQRLIQPKQFEGEGEGIELLTLSACQTAAGDDRAALGLAGVAVKAGARSAVATLWSVEDEASAALMTEFYRALRDRPGLSKAQAMREAQLALLRGRTTMLGEEDKSHAYYWSPFLVIGNWQ